MQDKTSDYYNTITTKIYASFPTALEYKSSKHPGRADLTRLEWYHQHENENENEQMKMKPNKEERSEIEVKWRKMERKAEII